MTRYTPYDWANGEAGGTPITAERLDIIEQALDLDIPVADIDATGTPSDTTYLRGDGTWSTPAGGGAADLDDLTDVDVSTTPPTDGQALVFDTADSLWKPATVSGGGGALGDLSDVDTTGQTTGQYLGYDGAQWEPTSLPAASDTTAGVQENATDGEATTGTATNRTMTPANVAAVVAALLAGSSLAEVIRDVAGAALVEGSGIDITVNDGADTITIAVIPARQQAQFSQGGVLTTGTGQFKIPNGTGSARTIHSVWATVGTAPTGAAVIVDANLGGTTIFTTQSNRPTIAVSTDSDESGTPDVTSWAAGALLTIDIDQIGSTIAGADLTVTVVYS